MLLLSAGKSDHITPSGESMLAEASDAEGPVYALVPARPLPIVDLSKSVRGQLLPEKAHSSIHRFLSKYHRPLLLANMAAMVLNVVVTGVDARSGQILSIASLVLWLPMGIAAPSTLRYDVVRLVMRTFDFWFFSWTTTLTTVMISIYFWDLRLCRMLIDWIGFHNIVLIDGQVRGLRPFIIVTVLGIPPLVFMLVWVMLDRLDGSTPFSLLSYRSDYRHFNLSGVDIIGNGMITLSLLIAKLVVRKRQSLKSQRMSTLLECVIYRCRLKLEQVDGQKSKSAARKNAIEPIGSCASTFRKPSLVQQMQFIKFPRTFDSNHVVLLLRVAGNAIALLYAIGVFGILLSFSSLIGSIDASTLLHVHTAALLCTVGFVAPFAALYQRELLKLLVTSFDFLFYVFQTTTATIAACILYKWECSRCLMLFTWWVWTQWALTLDALTPVMRDKLHFRPRMAAPIVALVLVGHIAVISRILFASGEELRDVELYRGVIWDRELVVRAIPFYVSRVATLCMWCPRLIWRLSTASKSEVTILRGGVCYDNYFAKHGRRRSREHSAKRLQSRRLQWPFHHASVKPAEASDRKAPTTGPPLIVLDAKWTRPR